MGNFSLVYNQNEILRLFISKLACLDVIFPVKPHFPASLSHYAGWVQLMVEGEWGYTTCSCAFINHIALTFWGWTTVLVVWIWVYITTAVSILWKHLFIHFFVLYSFDDFCRRFVISYAHTSPPWAFFPPLLVFLTTNSILTNLV